MAAAADESKREWLSGEAGREGGRDPGRDPGREVGFEPGGEMWSRARELISSESIQFRWFSGSSSSKVSPGGEVVTGVTVPELRRDAIPRLWAPNEVAIEREEAKLAP